MSALVPAHPAEAALHGVAEGSLRGPEGMAVRAHCDTCVECGAELATLEELFGTLALLRDPLAPDDFVPGVIRAMGVRESQVAARRHITLAALPAVAVGIVATFGWASSEGLVHRLNDLRTSFLVARTAAEVIGPLVAAARLPLAAGALIAACAICYALSRTLREGPRGPIEV